MIHLLQWFIEDKMWRGVILWSDTIGYIIEGDEKGKTTRLERVTRNEAEEYVAKYKIT